MANWQVYVPNFSTTWEGQIVRYVQKFLGLLLLICIGGIAPAVPVTADPGTPNPAPIPSATILSQPALTIQGSMVHVLVAACEHVLKLKHIDCGNDYILQSKVFVYDEGDHYTVIFSQGFDHFVGASVPKQR